MKRIFYAPIMIVALLVLSVVLVRSAIGAYLNDRHNREAFENRTRVAEELRGREQFLGDEIDRLQSERGVEEELRDRFPVAKEGETMVIIVESETGSPSPYQESKKGFWSRIGDFFR